MCVQYGPVCIFNMKTSGLCSISVCPVAYLGFYFGGEGSKFFWKSGGICMAQSAMQRVTKPHVCWGGSGACSPEKIYKNGAIWCVLESILLKFCQKINLKNSHFLYKNNR